MDLSPEQREGVAAELKTFGVDLNLTEDQKQELHTVLIEARGKVAEYLKTNPAGVIVGVLTDYKVTSRMLIAVPVLLFGRFLMESRFELS